MSGQIHPVRFEGAIQLPLTNGRYFTDQLWLEPGKTAFTVAFYDVNDQIVTPISGSIVAHLSPIAGQYHTPGVGDLIIPAESCGEFASYTIPWFSGPAHKGSAIFTDIDAPNAEYALCQFWRGE